MATSPTTA